MSVMIVVRWFAVPAGVLLGCFVGQRVELSKNWAGVEAQPLITSNPYQLPSSLSSNISNLIVLQSVDCCNGFLNDAYSLLRIRPSNNIVVVVNSPQAKAKLKLQSQVLVDPNCRLAVGFYVRESEINWLNSDIRKELQH